MATTTSTLSEFIQAQILKAADDQVAQHLFFPGSPLSGAIKTVDLTGGSGISAAFSKYNTLTAAAMTEGVDYTTLQQLDPSATTITASEVGVQGFVSDKAWQAITDPNAKAAYAQDIARNHVRAIMTKFDVDVMTLFASFDVIKGSTGVDLTNAIILAAVDACAKVNLPQPWYGILHPQQLADLYAESGSVFLDASKSADVGKTVYGQYYVGTVYGVQWFVNTNVPTANAGADRGGAIISGEAIGAVWAQMPVTTTEHDQSRRGDEILTSAMYGVAEIDGTMGIGIVTDA